MTGNVVTLIQTGCDSLSIVLVLSFLIDIEIGVAEKECSANLPFVEIGRRGDVRADGDFLK